MKHLLKLADLDKGDILDILNLADQLKYENQHGIEHHHLKGKTLGMIFQKSSTRTRVSFETGMYQLGGQALFLSNRDLQIGRGEPVQDTARVLSRYLDGIMIRTFAQKEVEDLSEYGSIPIINGLTDYCHPCQVLADLMTIREYKKSFDGLKFCFIGDGNNMANSLIVGAISMGMECAIACPKDYQPDAQIMAWAKENGIANGDSRGDFKPDQSVTRQELAAFLTRFDQYRGVPLAEGSLNLYSDANMTGVWAVESMRHAVGMGWLEGDGGRLLPGGVATRAQLAVILQRLTTQAMG